MALKMWMYDLAREQNPTLDHLRQFCNLTIESGYNALGLYLEHRFAYPSTPWSPGLGAVTPEMVLTIQDEFPNLQIIPFINLLGHFEGMMYTEDAVGMAEGRFVGLQACPSNPAFVELCGKLVDDTLSIFRSKIIHIGGDETAQLGACTACAARVKEYEANGLADGKAALYSNHFLPLLQKVVDAGRRPAIWGDMFFEHPTMVEIIPKETLIFDWQYFNSPSDFFDGKGYEVVACPAVHTYNAVWCHLPQTERNVLDHALVAKSGVCVTTWECGLFGNYETLFPIIKACGRILNDPESFAREQATPADHGANAALYMNERVASASLAAYRELGDDFDTWAQLMGVALQDVGEPFAFSGIRSSIKCRMLLYSNPFLLWLRNRDSLLGEAGTRASAILDHAIAIAPNSAYRGVSEFAKLSIDCVRFTEEAHQAYSTRRPGKAIIALTPCRQIFDALANVAKANLIRAGGSRADVERCRAAKAHVEQVILRVKQYGDGSLGYLPSFETITHPKFMPHDQANWWLINKWANE